MAYNDSQGLKYEATKNLNRAELKKVMLADLKAAKLPKGVRVALREGRGVGTLSLKATISGFKGILNPERVRFDEVTPTEYIEERQAPRLTQAATELQKRVEGLLEEYNYDRSDIQTDYFNVRFYLHVNFKSEDVVAERRAIVDAASPKRRDMQRIIEDGATVLRDVRLKRGNPKPVDCWGPTFTARAQVLDKHWKRETGEVTTFAAEVAKIEALPEDWNAVAVARAA